MMEKIRCGGLIQKNSLCLIEVLGYGWQPGEACGILNMFSEANLSLAFLNVGNSRDGLRNMSLCLGNEHLGLVQELVKRIDDELRPSRINVSENVTILTIYGPHFYEKQGLASTAYSAFCSAAINTMAVCSSVNSLSFVIDKKDTLSTIECLRDSFDWPE
jgi:aspartokinase